MKPLSTNLRALIWLCACPFDETASIWKRLAYISFTLIVIVLNICVVISSIVYSIKFIHFDLEMGLYAFSQIVAFLCPSYMAILNPLFLRRKIMNIFNKLYEIYDSSANEDYYKFLEHANKKSEWIWPIYIKYVLFFFPIYVAISAAISVILCLKLTGEFNVNHLHHTQKQILPWNQNTPIGYFAEVLYQMIAPDAFYITHGSVLLLFISICWHHKAFEQIIRHMMNQFDHLETDRNYKKSLCQIIQFHITVKNWFVESSEVYRVLILVQLVSMMSSLAVFVFQIHLRLKHIDFDFFTLLLAVVFVTTNLFIYCYFGKLATESFENMADCFFESNWHELPVDLQKYFIVMIGNAQQPLHYHGFGMTILNLDTFKNILRTVYTYYMVLRTITTH